MAEIIPFLRAVALMLAFLILGTISSGIILLLYPLLMIFDREWLVAPRITVISACLIGLLFVKIEVEGWEHVPSTFGHTIMVSNHQSTLDVCVLASLWPLKYLVVFKREILLIPGLGWCMGLSRYLSVDRRDKESGKKLLRDAAATLRGGKDVLWFPEGTRQVDTSGGPLGPFKPGAFKVAVEEGAAVLPISLSGARRLMPMAGGLPQLHAGTVRLRIHPAIASAGKSVEQLSAEVRAAIESGLRECDVVRPAAAKAATAPPPPVRPADALDKEG